MIRTLHPPPQCPAWSSSSHNSPLTHCFFISLHTSLSHHSPLKRICHHKPLRNKSRWQSTPQHNIRKIPTVSVLHTHKSSAASTSPTSLTVIPNDGRNPLIGVVRDLLSKRFVSLGQHEAMGPIYRTNILLREVIVVCDIDLISDINRDSKLFSSVDAYPGAMSNLFGRDAVLFLDGAAHMKQRAVLNKAFIPRIYNIVFEYMCESSGLMCRTIEASELDNASVDSAARAHFMRVITRLTVNDGLDGANEKQVVNAFQACAKTVMSVPLGPTYERGKEGRDFLISVFRSVILRILKTKREMIEFLRTSEDLENPKTARWLAQNDDLDLLTVMTALSSLPLLDVSHSTNQDETIYTRVHGEELYRVCNSIVVLWFAGYFTTSSTFICGLHELCENDNVLSRLCTEQNSVSDMTIESVNQDMPLLDAFISETLRLWPPAPFFNRRVTEDMELDGHLIPKNSLLHLDLIHAQRWDKYFPNPLTFDLDRYRNTVKHHPKPKLLSFGVPGGAHYCVGATVARLSLKVAFANVIRGYSFGTGKLDQLRNQNVQIKEFMFTPESAPRHGLNLQWFESRE